MSGVKEDPAQPAAAGTLPVESKPAKNYAGLLLKLGIFAALAAGAFAVVLFVVRPLFPPVAAGDAKPKPAVPRFGRVIALDSVVVNVAQTEGRRYLKVTVHLEVPDEEKLVKEVESRKPQLLDLIVATLTKKTLSEVTAPEALDKLRDEVRERFVPALGPERVRQVFITEFVVQ